MRVSMMPRNSRTNGNWLAVLSIKNRLVSLRKLFGMFFGPRDEHWKQRSYTGGAASQVRFAHGSKVIAGGTAGVPKDNPPSNLAVMQLESCHIWRLLPLG